MSNEKENKKEGDEGAAQEKTAVFEDDDFEFGDENSKGDESGDSSKKEGSESGDGDDSASGKNSSGDKGTEGDEGDDSGSGKKKEGEDGSGEGDKGGKGGDDDSSKKSGEDGKGDDEKDGDGKEGDDSKKDGDDSDGDKGDEGKGDEDFFGSEFNDSEGKDGDEGADKKLDIGSIAKEFDVEAETPEEFKEKISEKIEGAKKEFDLSSYSPEAQGMIKHINENGGKLEDFFSNENIASLQGVIAMDPESRVLSIRTNELVRSGMDAEKASEQAKEEIEDMSSRQIKDAADKIASDAKTLINEEIQAITGDQEVIAEQNRQKAAETAKNEQNHLITFVGEQDQFAGIDLSAKAKENIVRDIKSGEFDKIANQDPAKSKFSAYMFNKFGNKIVENFKKESSEQNRKGHNAAIKRQTDALHKSEDDAKTAKQGKEKHEGGEGGKFDGFSNEIFSDEE
jgi:hypothetical protein